MIQDETTRAIEKLLGTWLEEKSCTQLSLLSVTKGSLHEGEAEVIAIALEYSTKDVALETRADLRDGLVYNPLARLDCYSPPKKLI
ncbi:MAG: hypothetical protein QXN56_06425 [Candidatus Hadarchaeum sp.]